MDNRSVQIQGNKESEGSEEQAGRGEERSSPQL
jgi:hypothetical protein